MFNRIDSIEMEATVLKIHVVFGIII